MASVFKRRCDRKKKGAPWIMKYRDADGRWRTRTGCADKDASERMARKLETDSSLTRVGLIDPKEQRFVELNRRSVEAHIKDFEGHMIAKGGTTEHASLSVNRVRRLVALIKGACLVEIDTPRSATRLERAACAKRLTATMQSARLSDLLPSSVQAALSALREAGRSLQTCNHHRAALRAFVRWARTDGRLRDDPLAGVSGYNVKEDRRHDRRTLSVEELRKLIVVANDGPNYRNMTGPARALCYRLAAATGLRFKEIALLTPSSFRLAADNSAVIAKAAYTKNGESATLDLPTDVAIDLATYLSDRPEDEPAFPLPISADGSSGRGAAMLRIDLVAAGIPYRDAEGLVFDFHALRCEHATLLDLAGVSPRVVQRKMRHSSLELTGRYTRHRDADMKEAVKTLPNLRPGVEAPVASLGGVAALPDASAYAFAPNAHHGSGGEGRDLSAIGDDVTTVNPAHMGRKSNPAKKIGGLRRPEAVSGKIAPGRIRTCGLRFRKPSLYPPELRALVIERNSSRTPMMLGAWCGLRLYLRGRDGCGREFKGICSAKQAVPGCLLDHSGLAMRMGAPTGGLLRDLLGPFRPLAWRAWPRPGRGRRGARWRPGGRRGGGRGPGPCWAGRA